MSGKDDHGEVSAVIENDADNSSVTVTLDKQDCMKEMMEKYCERKNLRR